MTADKSPGEMIGERAWGQAGLPAITGGLAGAVAGWAAAGSGDVAWAVAAGGKLYLSLFLLLPASLAVAAWLRSRQDPEVGTGMKDALLPGLLAGFLGSVGASVLFFVAAVFIPVIVAKADPTPLRAGLLAEIGWGEMALLIVVSTTSALPIAAWLHRRPR